MNVVLTIGTVYQVSSAYSGKKAESKTPPKKAEQKTAPEISDKERNDLIIKAEKVLFELGFSLNLTNTIPFAEYIKSPKRYQLIRIGVAKKETADRLSRKHGINPNYFVVTKEAKGKALAIVRENAIEYILQAIISEYISRKGIKLEDENHYEKLFWDITEKISKKDLEIITLAKDVKKKLDPDDPLSKWNALKPEVEKAPVRFVNFGDFSPTPSQKKIELGKKLEGLIYDGGVNYRIKRSSALLRIIRREARALKIDLAELSPKDAVRFAAYVVEKNLKYNYRMLAELYGAGYRYIDRLVDKNAPKAARRMKAGDQSMMNESLAESRKIDERGVDELLLGKSGVCRNYSQAFNAVFYTLKELNPGLANVYSSGVYSEIHEWVMILQVEEKEGKKKVTATMIDPTTDDEDGIFENDLDASDAARDKYSTAQLLLRLGREEDFRKFFDQNQNDPHFQTFMLQSLAKRMASQKELFQTYEELSLKVMKNEKLPRDLGFVVRMNLAQTYASRGKFAAALEQFNLLKNQKPSYIDKHTASLFLANFYLIKGDLQTAEALAQKIADSIDGMILLADILMKAKRYKEALPLLKKIEKFYDYFETKLPARLNISLILARKGKHERARKYLANSEKYIRTQADRFAFTLRKANIEKESGKTEKADALLAVILDKYPDVLEENLTNTYTTILSPEDIVSLAQIAMARKDDKLAHKLLSFGINLIAGKADKYLGIYIKAAKDIVDTLKKVLTTVF